MLKGYLAISFANRKKFADQIKYLIEKLSEQNVKLLVFVDNYHFEANQEREMMETAFKQIDNSDFFIAELTHKSIGVGIEVGYAFASKKPIIYLRQTGASYSTTAAGCANAIIEYKNMDELVKKTIVAINKIKSI